MQHQDQDTVNSSSSSWQAMGKSDSASDTGDDTSSGKSGSTISSMNTSQPQDTTSISSTNVVQTSSSSLWNASNSALPGLDASPWGSSNSPAPSGMGLIGWGSNPSSLSLSSNQGHSMQVGSNIIGGSVGSSGSSTGWSSSVTGSGLGNNSGLSSGSGMQSNTLSSQWQSSTLLGNIGDFVKTSDSGWSNTSSSLLDSSKDMAGGMADLRMWGLSSDRTVESQWATAKNQWGTTPSLSGNEQGASNAELSFAQATQKGLKLQPPTNASQAAINSRQEEILRAIESHEGWGSRPIRQDTSWDVETSPKSMRKFSTDANNEATNVWNNSNGTAIWEAVRENQRSNWAGGVPPANSWMAEKDQPSWAGPAKPAPDPNTWNVGNNANGKDFGTWGVTGAAGDASNKMWGQKTEVGSWGDAGAQRSTTTMSSWGDDGDAGAWEDQRRVNSGIGSMQVMPPSPGLGVPSGMSGIGPQGVGGMGMTAVGVDNTPWNEAHKTGWNAVNAAAVSRPTVDEPWNKPPPARTGWGDTGHDNVDVDNGTSLWTSSVPKQGKMSGWADASPQGQWNTIVGTKPKIPAGWDESSWNLAQRAKLGGLQDDLSAVSVDVGMWNSVPQDNNTWSDSAAFRGVRKITGQMPQKFVSNGNNPPTQMRAKLLQHLLDMGFRKEEAQAALITNNLNIEMAINDLKAGNVNVSRKDLDIDVFQTNGSQPRMPYMSKGGIVGGDGMPDVRLDQVPNFNNNMHNTPFPNAQISNQSFVQTGASLPPSSLNLNNSSITPNLQQKLMHKLQQQQPPPSAGLGQRAPIPPVSSGVSSQVPQQQQQQILARLRQAVNNGFISPQLLNYQLPHNILVLLQQLLEFQSALQNMMSKQQQLMQQARATGNRSNPQLESTSGIISNINQQIIHVQKQLQQAQNALFSSQKPPGVSQPTASTLTAQPGLNMMDSSLDALSNDLAVVALQNQSRLATQWKPNLDFLPSTTADSTNNSTLSVASTIKTTDDSTENKVSGAKGILQSSSSPNLNLIPGGLGMTGDKTWSSNLSATSASNWPVSNDSAIPSSQADIKAATSTSVSTSLLSGLPSGLTDVMIPEFIPGKPWQGLAKNVEDDPHVTPGSIQYQRSLSVNRVHDESLNHLDGSKMSSGSSWNTGLKTDNSLGLSQLGSRPPPPAATMSAVSKGIGAQQWSTGGFNRQTSWPHSNNSAFTKVTGSGWNDGSIAPSSWLLLKNLTVDASTVRALSAQHGTLLSFHSLAQGQFALVQYGNREMAYVAQQRLNNFQMGSSVITAEFISEADAQRVAAQMPPPPPAQTNIIPPVNNSLWSQAPPVTPFQNAGMRSSDPWSNTMSTAYHNSKYVSGGGGDGYWGLWDRPEHSSNPLSNILGGESM